VDIQEVLSQAFGCLKVLIWAFSLNEVFFTCLCGNQRQSEGEKNRRMESYRKGQSESERPKENKLN